MRTRAGTGASRSSRSSGLSSSITSPTTPIANSRTVCWISNGAVWGIDHGLCFNVQYKLRTVLWQFVGMPVSPELMTDLARVRADEVALIVALDDLLEDCEMDALLRRMDAFLRDPCYPSLDPYRNVPYGWW